MMLKIHFYLRFIFLLYMAKKLLFLPVLATPGDKRSIDFLCSYQLVVFEFHSETTIDSATLIPNQDFMSMHCTHCCITVLRTAPTSILYVTVPRLSDLQRTQSAKELDCVDQFIASPSQAAQALYWIVMFNSLALWFSFWSKIVIHLEPASIVNCIVLWGARSFLCCSPACLSLQRPVVTRLSLEDTQTTLRGAAWFHPKERLNYSNSIN